MHAISGLLNGKSGDIIFNGENIMKTPAHKIVSSGLYSSEGRRIFAQLSVVDKPRNGCYLRNDADGIKKDLEHIYIIILMFKRKERNS